MTALSKLKVAAAYFRSETFVAWNDTFETFTGDSFVGRIYPVDRFKSIYHRPVLRETLGLDEDTDLPATLVVQHSSTSRIFILSKIRRRDVDADVSYDSLVSMHAVEEGSGGFATIRRYSVQGAGNNLGPLVAANVANRHCSLELRTNTADPDTHDEFVGHYFMTLPDTFTLQERDYILLNGRSFRVDTIYNDAGYTVARVAEEDYDKEEITYHMPLHSGGAYYPSSGAVTYPGTTDRIVSANVMSATLTDMQETMIDSAVYRVAIDLDHIGFEPHLGDDITIRGRIGKVFERYISSDRKQWILRVRFTTDSGI